MNTDLTEEDKLELNQRRMSDKVRESVEKTLRWRYTWLGLVTAFLMGGGGLIMVQSTLSKADYILDQSKERLKEIADTSERIKVLEVNLKSLEQQLTDDMKTVTDLSYQSRAMEFVAPERQERVEKIIEDINDLSDERAFELNKNPPVQDATFDKVIKLRDPVGRSFTDGMVAREMLKMRIVLSKRDDEALDAWETALKGQ